jgi:uncharacterized membrane protein YdbT with pleckstrin-like domain
MSALSTFTTVVVAFFALIGDYLGSMALGAWLGIVLVIGFVIAAYNEPKK